MSRDHPQTTEQDNEAGQEHAASAEVGRWLIVTAMAALALVLFALPVRSVTRAWGPAEFTIRLRCAEHREILSADDATVEVTGFDAWLANYEVRTQEDGLIKVSFPRILTRGKSVRLFGRRLLEDRGISLTIRVTRPGYGEGVLRYPRDFDIIDYGPMEKREWQPEVEEHARTLFLEPEA